MPPFLVSLQAKLIGAALAALLLIGVSAYVTHRVDKSAYDELKLSYAQAAAKAVAKAQTKQDAKDDATDKIAIADVAEQQKIVYRTKTITKEVPVYVTEKTDAVFAVPCGFVRLHDAAARGIDPSQVENPAGKSDGDTCEFTTSQVASAIVDNYGTALGWRQQLIDLQAAVRAEVEIDNQK